MLKFRYFIEEVVVIEEFVGTHFGASTVVRVYYSSKFNDSILCYENVSFYLNGLQMPNFAQILAFLICHITYEPNDHLKHIPRNSNILARFFKIAYYVQKLQNIMGRE